MQLLAIFSFVSIVSAMAIKSKAKTPVTGTLSASVAPATGALGIDAVFPTANGTDTVVLSVPQKIYGVWDGMMKRYDRGVTCTGQIEGLDKDAVFLVEDGATLKNVIIGPNQIEGIHCMGSCTLENVWWEDVCEDALTIRQLSGTSTIKGGGAKNAQDKVIQFNGGGTVVVDGFYAYNFGKLVRTCGNCLKQVHDRHIVVKNVIGKNGKWLAVANEKYGDTIDIQSACLVNVKKVCSAFDGNDTGAEPAEISTGPDSQVCHYDPAVITSNC